MESNENESRAGVFALICSVLFPIIGIICYFVNRKEVENASAYLYASLGGFVLGLLLRAIAAGAA